MPRLASRPKNQCGINHDCIRHSVFLCLFATVTIPETMQPNIFTAHIISDEEDNDSFQPKDLVEPLSPEEDNQEKVPPKADNFMAVELQTTLVDLGPITHMIPEGQEPTSLDPHDELLKLHYRLGHLPFGHIKQLAWMGQLPKHLLNSKKPFCSPCRYGRRTIHPWRVKGDNKNTTKMATRPGQIVSVD